MKNIKKNNIHLFIYHPEIKESFIYKRVCKHNQISKTVKIKDIFEYQIIVDST